EVGGRTSLRARELLAADAAPRVVCAVGKPAGARVAPRLAEALAKVSKPCVVWLPAAPGPSTIRGHNVHVAATLEDAGRAAVALARGPTPTATEYAESAADIERVVGDAARRLAPGQRHRRRLVAGGALRAGGGARERRARAVVGSVCGGDAAP